MNRAFVTTPIALLVSAGFMLAAAGPAAAADPRCTTLPAQARAAAQTADPSTARSALRHIATGEKLCEAGNEREAGKKFAAAFKTLGVEPVQVAAVER